MGLPHLERIDGRPVRVLCRHRISQISQEKCSFNNNLFNDIDVYKRQDAESAGSRQVIEAVVGYLEESVYLPELGIVFLVHFAFRRHDPQFHKEITGHTVFDDIPLSLVVGQVARFSRCGGTGDPGPVSYTHLDVYKRQVP